MSKGRLSLVLSLALHAVLFLGFFSTAARNGADAFVVELVSLQPASGGESIGPPALRPAPPAAPSVPVKRASPAVRKSGSDKPALPSTRSIQASAAAPVEEIQNPAPPAEPMPPSDPTPEEMERVLSDAPPEPASTVQLVADGSHFGKGPAAEEGGVGNNGAGDGAPQPTVSDALPGRIGGAGGGGIAPRFVMPKFGGGGQPKPRYPEAARDEGREGTALVKVTVLPTGRVGEAAIERSSGHADLDQAAVEAVMKWTFLPARRGENPVSASVRIPVTFALDNP